MAETDAPQPNPEKDPDDWVTGDEPATGPQLSYLGTLSQQTGEEIPSQLTKAQASKLIDDLQGRARGQQPRDGQTATGDQTASGDQTAPGEQTASGEGEQTSA